MALMTTMPENTSPNPTRTRRSIDQWVNHAMRLPVLGIGAGSLSETGSNRTGVGVAGRSCVTDSIGKACRRWKCKPMSWKLYPPPKGPARNILAECSMNPGEPSLATLASERDDCRGDGKGCCGICEV